MPVFPSAEWMTAFAQRLASHPEADDLADALDGVYRFVVEPAGPLRERRTFDMAIRPDDAGGADIALLDGERHTGPRLTLTADYIRWSQLIRGELDVGLALLLRRLRISGDLRRITGNLSSAQPLLESLHHVDTQWLE